MTSNRMARILGACLLWLAALAYCDQGAHASPYSVDTYTATGSQTAFVVTFPYIQQQHVLVTDNGTLKVLGIDYTFTSSGVITFTVAPTNGHTIVLQRQTPIQPAEVTFSGGALSSQSLNLNTVQSLYGIQELADGYGQAGSAAFASVSLANVLPNSSLSLANLNLSGLAASTASYAGLNASVDVSRFAVGGFPTSAELGGAITDFSTAALVGAIQIPAGTYTGATSGWPDAGLAGYALTNNTTKSGVALYTLAGEGVAGGKIYGANISTVNCALFKPSCTATTGMNVATQYGLEVDSNVYGVGSSSPTGNVAGVISIAHATKIPTGDFTAFEASNVGLPWNAAFASNPGSSLVGMSLGPLALTANADGQPINLYATNGAATIISGSVAIDHLGNVSVQPPTGGAFKVVSVLRPLPVTFANIGVADPSPVVGDLLVIADAAACTVGAAVVAGGGGTTHTCLVAYNGSGWQPVVTH